MNILATLLLLTLNAHAGSTQNLPLLDPLRGIPHPVGSPVEDLLNPELRPLIDLGYGEHSAVLEKNGALGTENVKLLLAQARSPKLITELKSALSQIDAWNAQLATCQRTSVKECDRILNHDRPRILGNTVRELQFLAEHPQLLEYREDESVLREALPVLDHVISLMMSARI
jgi:hypothetical protein